MYSFEFKIVSSNETERKECISRIDKRFSELRTFHNLLQQVPHIKQTMKCENINFPSKMCFSNETRAKQLTDYYRKLVHQESIINNGHFQLEINFNSQNPNVWDNVYKKYNQNQQQLQQQLKEEPRLLKQNQSAEKPESPRSLHVHAQEHVDDQSRIHTYSPKGVDKNEIKNAEAAEMETENVKSKPSTINESEMSESKNDDAMERKQSHSHHFDNEMNNPLIIPDHLSFKVQNGIENSCKITKMYRKRDMFICLLNSEKNCIKSFLGHKCIVLTYLSKFENPINVQNHESKYDVSLEIEADILEYSLRIFMIELFFDEKTNKSVLALKGPLYHTRDYKCEKLYYIHTSMNDIIELANNEMIAFGDYKYLTNNCQTFARDLINEAVKLYGVDANVNFTWQGILELKSIYCPEYLKTLRENVAQASIVAPPVGHDRDISPKYQRKHKVRRRLSLDSVDVDKNSIEYDSFESDWKHLIEEDAQKSNFTSVPEPMKFEEMEALTDPDTIHISSTSDLHQLRVLAEFGQQQRKLKQQRKSHVYQNPAIRFK